MRVPQRVPQPQLEGAFACEARPPKRPRAADALCKKAVATEDELGEQELQRAGDESDSPVLHGNRLTAGQARKREESCARVDDGCVNVEDGMIGSCCVLPVRKVSL